MNSAWSKGRDEMWNWDPGPLSLLDPTATRTTLFRFARFLFEEAFLVLLTIAAAAVVILFLLFTFVVFEQGVRFGFRWIKISAAQIKRLAGRPLAHREVTHHPNLR